MMYCNTPTLIDLPLWAAKQWENREYHQPTIQLPLFTNCDTKNCRAESFHDIDIALQMTLIWAWDSAGASASQTYNNNKIDDT